MATQTEIISFKLSPTLRDAIRAEAIRLGLTQTGVIRLSILNQCGLYVPAPRINPE